MRPAPRQGIWALALALALGLYGAVTGRAQPQPALVTVLHYFGGGSAGALPMNLFLGPNNAFYGTTYHGGNTNDDGTVFKMNTDGSGYAVLHKFTSTEQKPAEFRYHFGILYYGATVIEAHDGALYGTTSEGRGTYGSVFKMNTDGSGYTVLHEFSHSDENPLSLIQGRDGALYGAGVLAVFKLDTDGSHYAALHLFNISTEGENAEGKLLQGRDGKLYGTCFDSGTNGSGTLFELNTNGSGFQVLHSFPAFAGDGEDPRGGLIEGSDGVIYGTTEVGGAYGVGTIFELNPDGTGYKVLHSFQTNGVDGENPSSGLVQGLDNMLYGATAVGGTGSSGTIFELGMGGGGYQVLYNLDGYTNGEFVFSNLVPGPASDGGAALYGLTEEGGRITNSGALFGVVVNPPLTITPAVSQSGSHPVVTWPAWALNYELQTTTNLASTNWVTTTNYIPVTGAELTNSPPHAYYRLIWKP